MSIYPLVILKSFIISCNSGEDLQDREEESPVYEREYVEHGANCSCCTSFAKSAELEKQRELWWKQRRKRKGFAAVTAATERDFFDPTCEYWDREDSN
jgi:hypothetical protein